MSEQKDARVAAAGPAVYDSTPDLPLGSIFANLYKIEERLGIGGMGVVYKCRDLTVGRTVAIKFLLPHLAANEKFLLRFHQEAKAAGRLSHRNIIDVYHFSVENEMPFIVMDYARGSSLADLLQTKKTIEVKRCLKIMRQVADALAHAHAKGVIHRDLKPANILLLEGTDDVVKILDFGIAKINEPGAQGAKVTQTGEIFGSPAYMSPEQALGNKVDARADQYAMGCAIFECLTGSAPFTGTNSVEVMMQHIETEPPPLKHPSGKRYPAQLEAFVRRLMSKQPAQRFATASEVVSEIDDLLNPASTAEQLTERLQQTNFSLIGLIAGAIVMLPLSWWGFGSLVKTLEKNQKSQEKQQLAKTKTKEDLTFDSWGNTAKQTGADTFLRMTIKDDSDQKVYYVGDKSISDKALSYFLALPRLRELYLDDCRFVTGRGLKALAPLPLEHLSLNGTGITGNSLIELAPLRNLHNLELADLPLDDASLSALKGIPLYVLNLSSTHVTGQGCQTLSQLKGLTKLNLNQDQNLSGKLEPLSVLPLEEIDLKGTDITDADLPSLLKFKKLTQLDLSATKITDACAQSLKRFTNLEGLCLNGCKGLSPSFCQSLSETLKPLKHLKRLELSQLPIDDGTLVSLQNLPFLSALSLSHGNVTASSLEKLANVKGLRSLSLDYSTGLGGNMEPFRQSNLEQLELKETDITDADLLALAGMRHLKRLDLSGTKITDAGMDALKQMNGLTFISLNRCLGIDSVVTFPSLAGALTHCALYYGKDRDPDMSASDNRLSEQANETESRPSGPAEGTDAKPAPDLIEK